MFRQAFAKRRCLVAADALYEWQGSEPPKQPYLIHKPDDAMFFFAGLWERWRLADDPDTISNLHDHQYFSARCWPDR